MAARSNRRVRRHSLAWGSILLAVMAAAAVLAASPAHGARSSSLGSVDFLTLLGFQAQFDGTSKTNYTATVDSYNKVKIKFAWRMQYVTGRCGDFKVFLGDNPQDTGNAQSDTVTDVTTISGSFVSYGTYDHEGCPDEQEHGEILTLNITRVDPITNTACTITYSQKARDNDIPGEPIILPPTTSEGVCSGEPPKPPPPPPPATPPPPKKTLTPEAKADIRNQGKKAAAKAVGYGVVALGSTLAAGASSPTGIGFVVFIGVAVNFGTMAVDNLVEAGYASYQLAKDPPDASTHTIAIPAIASAQHAKGCTKIKQALLAKCLAVRAQLDRVLTAEKQAILDDRALVAAQNRFGTALGARANVAASTQAAAAKVDLGLLASALQQQNTAELAIAKALRRAGLSRLIVHPGKTNKLKHDVDLLSLLSDQLPTNGIRQEGMSLTAPELYLLAAATSLPPGAASKVRGDASSIAAACTNAELAKAGRQFAMDLNGVPAATARFLRAAEQSVPATPPPTSPTCQQTAVSEQDTWAHTPDGTRTTICSNLRTTPPMAFVSGELTGPGGFDAKTNGKQPLHADGTAQVRTIVASIQAGSYTAKFTVYDQNGNPTASSSSTFVIASPPHNGPIPQFGQVCPAP